MCKILKLKIPVAINPTLKPLGILTDFKMDVPSSESPVDIKKKGMEVSMNTYENLKCMESPVMPSKISGMRKKRICYQHWNTFGRCKSGDSCPYNHDSCMCECV